LLMSFASIYGKSYFRFFIQQIYGRVMIDSIDKFYDFIDKADDGND
jgi:hypothetical protein